MSKAPAGGGSFQVPQKKKSLAKQADGLAKSVAPKVANVKMDSAQGVGKAANVGGGWNGDMPSGAKASNPMDGLGGGKKLGNHFSNK